ncbi:MAG: cupin domain-containing protein [Gammaproteobacteria bacterium]|nr:cupin domain-containing protein [Gammaproteobacteria bacterium]
MSSYNLFNTQPLKEQAESFETLLKCRNVKIERIHSPANTRSERYVQQQDEWICLLQGEAKIEMESRITSLARGETLFIPKGTPHRVMETSSNPLCIWLAVHIH